MREGMHAGHVGTAGDMAIVRSLVAWGDEICHGIFGDTHRELVFRVSRALGLA